MKYSNEKLVKSCETQFNSYNNNFQTKLVKKEEKLEKYNIDESFHISEEINLREFFDNAEGILNNSSTITCTEQQENSIEHEPDFTSEFENDSYYPLKSCQENQLNIGIDIEYVESSLNFKGNYHNYITKVLKSALPLRFLNFSSILENKKIILPENDYYNRFKKTLILDLDETLIHADFDNNFQEFDEIITFMYDGREVKVPIILRPGVFQFLENISEMFEVFVFTASKREYADAVLNFLDPDNRYFKNKFYREHCVNVKNKIFIKDLRIFCNRKLENIIIVDNSLYSFCNQLSNGILINSFFNDREDRELFNLYNYLQQYISNAIDCRIINENVFNFKSIFDHYTNFHYAQEIYC